MYLLSVKKVKSAGQSANVCHYLAIINPTKVVCFSRLLKCLRTSMANSVDPDQTASIGKVCSSPTLLASLLNLSIMLGNYLQQTTSADDIFRCIFFLAL